MANDDVQGGIPRPSKPQIPANGGIGLAIGGAITVFFVLLPFLLVPVIGIFWVIYAAAKWSAFDASTVNLPIFLGGIALIVALLAVLLFVGVGQIGKALAPKRSKRRGTDAVGTLP